MMNSDRTATMSHDELVVLQLLEEISQLILPSPSGTPPSTLRLQAAAKLYLDTRDTFEVIERSVESHLQQRPKFLRKLSKRNGINQTPRESIVDGAGSVPATPRQPGEAEANAGTVPPRSEPPSRRSSVAFSEAEAPPVNDVVLDRIQEMFRYLGERLSRPVLDELRARKLTLQSALHYVRFLPQDAQWTAYREQRDEEVRLAYNPQKQQNETLLQQLKRNAEFIKEQIRKDVNSVCIFSSDGTLSTIFGDDISTDNEAVAEKFEILIRDVYSRYLLSIIDMKMDQLMRVSEQWQQDMAIMGSSPASADAPQARLYIRSRKFRSKIPIFPQLITAIDESWSSAMLPPTPPGQQARVLVADLNHLGVWWQKSILAATDRDVTTVHTDESRGIVGTNASLDGQIYVPLMYENYNDFLRKYAKNGGITKWQGHRLLVNNGKDSLWVEVTVVEAEDRKFKVQLKKTIEKHHETASWQQLIATNEWIHLKDIKLCVAPSNPSFRVHMGLKLRTMIDVFQSLVTEISSIFPNEDLEMRVGKSLWQAVEPSISRGEHVFARYFRSVLNQEWQPRRHNAVVQTERSPSVLLSSASVRHLVAALDHSTGSISGPSSSSAPVPSSARRRMSLSAASHSNNVSVAAEVAFFDDKGMYHYKQQFPDVMMRVNETPTKMSPFEKLSHHLLEEKEMIGSCINNNNIALGRAFAQILQEKLNRLAKQVQANLEQDEHSSLEVVVTEYANATRFLYVWRIVRHELDTTAKQRRNKRDNANTIHTEWVDRCFHRMEALITAMLQLQLQYLQRTFFHECSSQALPGICEQDWTASKPWFSNSRCTYAIQFAMLRLQNLFENVILKLLNQYERVLSVHEKMYDMSSWLLVDLVSCITSMYESMVVSRARTVQWKIDVLYFVVGVHKLLRLLDKMLAPKSAYGHQTGRGSKKPSTVIREMCLRLLACMGVRTAPAIIVAEELTTRFDMKTVLEHQVDAITEFEVYISAIRAACGIHRQASSMMLLDEESTMWTNHSVFGDMELKHLADIELNWSSLISRSCLSADAMLASVKLRHELGSWEYPALTDEQLRERARLQECLNRVEAQKDLQLPPERPPSAHQSSGTSRGSTPDPNDPLAPFRRASGSSRSLQGPAANGGEKQTPLLPNNPSPEHLEPAPVKRTVSLSPSPSKSIQADILIAVAVPPPPDPVDCEQNRS